MCPPTASTQITIGEKTNDDIHFLNLAYQEAQCGLKEGGIPIGAVLVIDNKVVAKGHNKRVQEHSMIKHGETDCLENTQRQIKPEDMQRATLYTTLSPCYMCAGAILLNNIPRVVIGENKTFEQSELLLKQKGVEVVILNDQKCMDMLLDFILKNPTLWGEDIGLTRQQVLNKYKSLVSLADN
jgi:cytosine/creatinine deaminase